MQNPRGRAASRRLLDIRVDIYANGYQQRGKILKVNAAGAVCTLEVHLEPETVVAVGIRGSLWEKEHTFFVVGQIEQRSSDGASLLYTLRWVRAESNSSLAAMAVFLEEFLGVVRPVLEVSSSHGQTDRITTHRFQNAPPLEETSSPRSKTLGALPRHTTTSPNLALGTPTGTGPGSLTMLVSRSGLRAPTSLDATVQMGSAEYQGRVLFLSTSGLFVQLEGVTARSSDQASVLVRFSLDLGHRFVQVSCLCRILAADDGATTGTQGLDLEILRTNDDSGGEALKEYVRKMHFQSLTQGSRNAS